MNTNIAPSNEFSLNSSQHSQLQKYFTKIVLHSRGMSHRSEEDGICKYRSPDGGKCFIGAIIPDEKYLEEFDLDPPILGRVLEKAGLPVELEPYFCTLQSIHDSDFPLRESRLAKFARNTSLSYTPPEESEESEESQKQELKS